jgi:hypothetical protein
MVAKYSPVHVDTQAYTSPVHEEFITSPTKNHKEITELDFIGKYLDNLHYIFQIVNNTCI